MGGAAKVELKNTNLGSKYVVIKIDDVTTYLSLTEHYELLKLIQKISHGREAAGKKLNEYVVYNLDAPRADEVVAIVEEEYGLRRSYNSR